MLIVLLLLVSLSPLMAVKRNAFQRSTDDAFIVQIHYEYALVCTASLLSARLVLTAAHCFPNNSPWWQFYVLTGASSVAKRNTISDRQIHYKYSQHDFLADIAVAKLSLPINNTDVQYARLCSKPMRIGAMVTLSAYERYGYKFESNPLLAARMRIISLSKCRQELQFELPPNIICAGGLPNSTNICLGDSGGAMLYNGELCGIKVWAYECDYEVKPNILINVAYYKKFIDKAITTLSEEKLKIVKKSTRNVKKL